MMRDPLTTRAVAAAPDPDRDGRDASTRLPEWLVHLIALVIHAVLRRMVAARARRYVRAPAWCHEHPDLPLASAQAEAASLRGPFGFVIAWMCVRRGIGPGHPDWPLLSRAIVAFGGSIEGAQPGIPATGLLWWENPHVCPGMSGEIPSTPAADALAALLARDAATDADVRARDARQVALARQNVARSVHEPVLPPAFLRPVFARTATGPPTGPPVPWAHQFAYA